MRNEFVHNCGNLFTLIKGHVSSPSDAMSNERLEENFGNCNPVRRYLLPMSAILTIASLVSSTLLSIGAIDVEQMIYNAIITALSPFVFFFVVRFFSAYVFSFFGIKEQREERAQVVTLQLMMLFFLVNLLCRLVPDSKLLNCIYVYAFYMLWFMAGEYLGIAGNKRTKFMFAELVLCALAYMILPLLLKGITPKHP